MGLRLNDGIQLDDFSTGINHDAIGKLVDHGLLVTPDEGRLSTTADGRKVLNAVIRELLD